MNLSLPKLYRIMPDLNRRPLDESDFWQVCESRKIDVIERRQKKKGYYVPTKDGDFVFIDSRLKNLNWLTVAYHELFHALLHFPAPFLAGKHQFEANAFTIISLCPLPALSDTEYLRAANYCHVRRFIIRERQRLNFLYGI